MRRLCVLMVSLLVAGLPETCRTAEITYHDGLHADGWHADGWHAGQAGCCAAEDGDSCVPCCGRARSCRRSGCSSRRCRTGLPHVRRMAAVGQFNCGCRGSYKFPVPPQYTYHWPGMYAQQTMTEYTSPWRFPPLDQYHGGSARRGPTAGRLLRLPPPPRLEEPDDLESAGGAGKETGWRAVVR